MRIVLLAALLLLMVSPRAHAAARVAALAPGVAAHESTPQAWRPAIAVLPFADRTDGAWLLWTGRDVGEGFAQWVADSLARSGRWRLPDAGRVTESFAQRERQVLLSDANASVLGASFGAELALTGTVVAFEVTETQPDARYTRWGVGNGKRRTTATVVVELRLLDCASGAVVRSGTVRREEVSQSTSSAGEDRIDPVTFNDTPLGRAARAAVAATVRLLEEELTARSSVRVAQVLADHVILDAGRARGLAAGQRLAVMRPEIVTLDPSDGVITSQSERVAAELVVTGFADAGGRRAVCRVHRGSVQPGDQVRLVAEASGGTLGRN